MKRAGKRTTQRSAAGSLSRRRFLRAGAAAAATVAGSALAAKAPAPAIRKPSRPNILFINTDQQGLDTLSAYGCPGINTPNMDRLAAVGLNRKPRRAP